MRLSITVVICIARGVSEYVQSEMMSEKFASTNIAFQINQRQTVSPMNLEQFEEVEIRIFYSCLTRYSGL